MYGPLKPRGFAFLMDCCIDNMTVSKKMTGFCVTSVIPRKGSTEQSDYFKKNIHPSVPERVNEIHRKKREKKKSEDISGKRRPPEQPKMQCLPQRSGAAFGE